MHSVETFASIIHASARHYYVLGGVKFDVQTLFESKYNRISFTVKFEYYWIALTAKFGLLPVTWQAYQHKQFCLFLYANFKIFQIKVFRAFFNTSI